MEKGTVINLIGEYESVPVYYDMTRDDERVLRIRGPLGEENPERTKLCVISRKTGKVETMDGKPFVADDRPMGIKAYIVGVKDIKTAFELIRRERGLRALQKFGL